MMLRRIGLSSTSRRTERGARSDGRWALDPYQRHLHEVRPARIIGRHDETGWVTQPGGSEGMNEIFAHNGPCFTLKFIRRFNILSMSNSIRHSDLSCTSKGLGSDLIKYWIARLLPNIPQLRWHDCPFGYQIYKLITGASPRSWPLQLNSPWVI